MATIDAADFEGFQGSHDIDIPTGDSEQVLGLAYMQNAGQAIGDSDLYPEGEYLLHKVNGMFDIYIIKQSKTDFTFVTRVYNHVIEAYHKELQFKKDQAAASDGKEGSLVYDVPVWVLFELALNVGVHPTIDEAAFEKALWDYFPHLWIDESKAPKRLIK